VQEVSEVTGTSLLHFELDYIINYDIKYRMGKDAGEQ